MVSLSQGMSNYTCFGDGMADDWLYISPNLGFKDEAQQGEMELNTVMSTVREVVENVVNYGTAFANGTESVENALTCLQTAKDTLSRMAGYQIDRAISQYNDNKEKAMSEHYRQNLQQLCRDWDAFAYGNYNYCTKWWSPTRGRITNGWWSNGSFQRIQLQPDDIHYESESTGSYDGKPVEYDQIKCDRLIKSWDTFFDMRNDRMVQELEKRKNEIHFELQDLTRPADTGGSGGGGTTITASGGSHSSGKF